MIPSLCASLLEQLIGIHTENPGGNEHVMCRFLGDELKRRGAESVEVVDVSRQLTKEPGSYVYATYGSPHLLINAHVDTVPAGDGWAHDPWKAEIMEDKIVGLGTADTKGAIAAILTALESTTPHNVGILFSGDEERGTSCMNAFLRSPRIAGIRLALVCEPTSQFAGTSHRGMSSFLAQICGKGGHSSRADFMPRPVVTMARLALALDDIGRRYTPQGSEEMRGICMNIASIEGGVAFNVVPNSATLTWSIRPPHGFDHKGFDNEVQEVINRIDPTISLIQVLKNPPFVTRNMIQFDAMFGGLIKGTTPLEFWTEAAALSTAGIDAVVVGPGDVTQAHSPNEWISCDDLNWAVDLFTHIFQTTRDAVE